MYKVEDGKLKQRIWRGQLIEVSQPAVLFDISREDESAVMLKQGEQSTVEEYKNGIEKVLAASGMTALSEYVLVTIADVVTDVEQQCVLMNYLVEYSNRGLYYALAAASSGKRIDIFQDILAFDSKLKSYTSL